MKSNRKANVASSSANAIDLDLGDRVRAWLRDTAYPGDCKAKRIARDFDVSEGTAKLWLAGKLPESRWLKKMAQRWGWDFWNFVGQPLCGGLGRATDPANLRSELGALQARLARLEARQQHERNLGLVVSGEASDLPMDREPPDEPGGTAAGRARQGSAAEAVAERAARDIDYALPARPAQRWRA